MTTQQLDANAARLCAREPYFAPNFEAARALLQAATIDADGLYWSGGALCGPQGCSCGNRGCLHQTAWRIFCYAN